ncbi:MAG TPA: type I polyketide synthase [Ktedonobacteraceae bacterium]|nr:type I polyketide synthase [Ktedonobacteraceae bacterium]
MPDIAIVGMACRYPDARSPQELWENVLAQRQAFRRIPAERLRLEDYFSEELSTPDATYASQAAVIDGYLFDRTHFRISGSTYRTSDLAHWLALDIAAQALTDAGFHSPDDLPAQTSRVIVGNTLTGEFSRAQSLRLRWPYVRRVVEATLREEGWSGQPIQDFVSRLETLYKAPFAPIGEETLAGGLSNTIAGRICNYFHLQGGGYTVDGACASSLLAVATASTALASGECDLALAGGVDLSLDPFELVGFAKTSALTSDEMWVYDMRSHGFIPGEGCGFVVLMRHDDALAQQRRIYALIRGWGISSDGGGGITRPDSQGQALALARAYQRAGIGIETVEYFEGHGTGTSVGDQIELQTVARARQQASVLAPAATIGSVKANIGHTKAAAGVAGLIKAVMALTTQIIPPTTGSSQPHAELLHEPASLLIRPIGTLWPVDRPLRAGVSAMGFGGINTHVVLEGTGNQRRERLTAAEETLCSTPQDMELFPLAAQDNADLHNHVTHLLSFASRLSKAELTDLSLHLMRTLSTGPVRAAILASRPSDLASRLERVHRALEGGEHTIFDPREGVFLGSGQKETPRLGFLFPGQGSPAYLHTGLLRRRFDFVHALYCGAQLPAMGDEKDTVIAQPAIVTASLAALSVLKRLGITAEVAVGHSLGELSALHWAGAFDEQTLQHLAQMRGAIMGSLARADGAMASFQTSRDVVEALIADTEGKVVIAGLNTPRQVVIAGEADALAVVMARARQEQIQATPLKVSHAFHSPLVAAAVSPFVEALAPMRFHPLQRIVISTVTGAHLPPEVDLKALLCTQITSPVLFADALRKAAAHVDMFVEVGPGQTLSHLASECVPVPALSIDGDGPSITGLLRVVGALFSQGAPVEVSLLAQNRFSRPFNLSWQPRFFSNPCEQAPLPDTGAILATLSEEPADAAFFQETTPPEEPEEQSETPFTTIDMLRQLVARHAELPQQAIEDYARMLSDLHLNSITVGQIISEAARALHLRPPIAPTEYADATLTAIAEALTELPTADEQEGSGTALAGVDAWIRAFTIQAVETPDVPAYLPEARAVDAEQNTCLWQVRVLQASPFAQALQQTCASLPGTGVIVLLPAQLSQEVIALLLQGAQEALRSETPSCFVLVQQQRGGAGVARTLSLEAPHLTVCVVDVPPTHPQAIAWVMAEIQAAQRSGGYHEVLYDALGRRRIPILQLCQLTANQHVPLSLDRDDLLLVTGGGKGIAAECALSLALETGVRLVLLGRSDPSRDPELAANLQRLERSEVAFCYVRADVTNPAQLQQAISDIEDRLGPVTALLHGVGTNTPRLLSTLTEEEFCQTLAPKVEGLQHVLSAIAPHKLRLLVTFGSVIARTGMKGEADYAVANDWLADLTVRFQQEHPACRCLCLEWSVWAGVGMGERLGRIEALMREGIHPIPVDKGVSCFLTLLHQRLPDVRIIVTSRFGSLPTLRLPAPELPFLRFLEQPQVYFPGIELISDVELSTTTDPYLEEHKLHGERLLPAVVGLEAMAQVAMAVTGRSSAPHFTQVQLNRPVAVPQTERVKIRLAALVAESGEVETLLLSEETGFQVAHFRATCHFEPQQPQPLSSLETLARVPAAGKAPLALDPAQDLYGPLLFHEGRFQRIQHYLHLHATECVTQISSSAQEQPFVYYLPASLVLGDFSARDALIHGIQACIPQGRLLPVAVEEIRVAPNLCEETNYLYACARERNRVEDLFTYDVEMWTSQGQMCEQWLGLQLRLVETLPPPAHWHEVLLGPYLERKLNDFYPEAALRLLVQNNHGLPRRQSSDLAFQSLLEADLRVQRRSDGKPVVVERLEHGEQAVSASHTAHLTLVVASIGQIGCDVEAVRPRSHQVWQDVLGPQHFQLACWLAAHCQQNIESAATRVWAAGECLKKVGAMLTTPLYLDEDKDDGWILFRAGALRISTYLTQVQGEEQSLIFAVCSAPEQSQEMEHIRKYASDKERSNSSASL